MANDRIAALEAKLETRSIQRDNDIAGIREDLATLAESLRSSSAVNGELARRVTQLESVPRPSAASYWGPAIATAATLAAALGWALDERVTPIKDMALNTQEDTRQLSGLYGDLSRQVVRSDEKLTWIETWVTSIQQAGQRLDENVSDIRVQEADRHTQQLKDGMR